MNKISDEIEIKTADDAVEVLARVLHDEMEHIDPSFPASHWETLSDAERQFYLTCASRLSLEVECLRILVGDQPGDGHVCRG